MYMEKYKDDRGRRKEYKKLMKRIEEKWNKKEEKRLRSRCWKSKLAVYVIYNKMIKYNTFSLISSSSLHG